MDKKSLAEAIFLFNRIETLLRQRGGQGESFSDLVKSFNVYLDKEPEIKEHTDYIAYKKELIGGFYNNLRSIAFERNNLLHQSNYTIKNFPRFKKACYQVIDFLEKGKQPRFGIINLHRNDSLRNRLTTFAWDTPSFWLRILITVPVVYWLFHYFNVCADCSETVSYVWIGIVSLFFYSMVFMLLDIFKFAFRSEENMQAVVFGAGIIFFGSMFLAHSCSGNKKHIASTAVPDTNRQVGICQRERMGVYALSFPFKCCCERNAFHNCSVKRNDKKQYA